MHFDRLDRSERSIRAILRIAAVLVLGPTFLVGHYGVADAATAVQVLGWCRPDSKEHSSKLCEGYVTAIAEIASKPHRLSDSYGVACIPQDVTPSQLISLVVEKVRPDPELDRKTGFDAITPVLVKSFPCKR